ncbi:hypothetical protein AAY473_028637, partial [Plecturocebus cupreus]
MGSSSHSLLNSPSETRGLQCFAPALMRGRTVTRNGTPLPRAHS